MTWKELICKVIGHKWTKEMSLPEELQSEIRYEEAKYDPEAGKFLESSKAVSYKKCLRCGGTITVKYNKYWNFPKKSQ